MVSKHLSLTSVEAGKSRINVPGDGSGEISFLGCQGRLFMLPDEMEKTELSLLSQGHKSLPEDLTTMASLTLLPPTSWLPDTIRLETRNVLLHPRDHPCF